MAIIKFLVLAGLWFQMLGENLLSSNYATKVEYSINLSNGSRCCLSLVFSLDKFICFKHCSRDLASIWLSWWDVVISFFFKPRMNGDGWYLIFSLPLMLNLRTNVHINVVGQVDFPCSRTVFWLADNIYFRLTIL